MLRILFYFFLKFFHCSIDITTKICYITVVI